MELCWLEAFLALAETGSIRAAAARLGVSPSTLSERVSALEEQLGVKLLDRRSRKTALTGQGELYLDEARALLERWQTILEQVRTMDTRPVRCLRLAFQGRILPPLVGRFLDQFLLRHPDITPSLYNDQEIGIADGLGSGKVDAYFAYSPQEAYCASLSRRPVFRTCLGALVPNRHSLAWKSSISLSELDGETFLLYPETCVTSLRERELSALRAAGIRYSLFEGHLSPIYYTLPVQMGQGIAICPMQLQGHTPRFTTLLPLTDPLCRCSIDMLWHPENDNPALRLFLEEFGTQEGEDAF